MANCKCFILVSSYVYYIIDKIYLWYFYKFIHKTEKQIIENIINYELKKFGSSYNQVLKEPIINGEEWYTYYTFSTEKEYRKWKRYSIKQIKKRSPYMTNSYALKQFSWVSLQYGLKLGYDDTKTN